MITHYPLCWPSNAPLRTNYSYAGLASMATATAAIGSVMHELKADRVLLSSNAELSSLWLPDWHPDGTPKLDLAQRPFGPHEQSAALWFEYEFGGRYCVACDGPSLADNLYVIARFLNELQRTRRVSEDLYWGALCGFDCQDDTLPRACWREVLRIKPGVTPTMAHLTTQYADAKARGDARAEPAYRAALIELDDF